MTISTIRRATEEDYSAVETAAERFCARHDLTPAFDGEDWLHVVICATTAQHRDDFNARRLHQLWTGCFCRALRRPRDARLTIAYGHVGLSVK